MPLTQDIIVNCDSKYSYLKNKMELKLSKFKKEMLKQFELPDYPPITINFYASQKEYQEARGKATSNPVPEYATMSYNENEINMCVDSMPYYQIYVKLQHELVHMIYSKVRSNFYKKETWLDEGLAAEFSDEYGKLHPINGEYTEERYKTFRRWYMDNIANIIHQVPHIETLNKTGEQFSNEIYDGYALSFIIVHYLRTLYDDHELNELIRDKNRIAEIKKYILPDAINYYNKLLGIDKVKSNFNEVESIDELMDYMNMYIGYGWVDKNSYLHVGTLKDFKEKYRVSTIEETTQRNVGVCVEQALLIKNFLERQNIETKMFVGFEGENLIHAFVCGHIGDKWVYVEHSNFNRRGVHYYDSLDDLIEDLSIDGGYDSIIEADDIKPGMSYLDIVEYKNKQTEKGKVM